MGLFDIFKKKNSTEPNQSVTKAVDNPESEYLDDITFIAGIKHIPLGPWHQYDILFASQIYGWDFMVKWADYMSAADLINISEVIVGEMNAAKNNITEQFCKNGNKIIGLPEASVERGMLSIAGISNVLKSPTKIVWVNQTRALRIFILESDEMLIKKYAETIARWSFGTDNAMKLGKPIPERH